jgi:hypothetical protein
VIGPALTLIGIFVGILGGMLVAAVTLDMPPVTFWARIVDRVALLDFVHGLGKSLVLRVRSRKPESEVQEASICHRRLLGAGRVLPAPPAGLECVQAAMASDATFTRHG